MLGYESYKTTDIETASKLKLVVMLYNGAIKFTSIALEATNNQNFEIAHENILRAQDIVGELLSSLNFDAGDIAQELSSLYVYIHKLLVEGNIKKDAAMFQEAIELLTNLKSGWDELLSLEDTNNSTIKNINISS